MRNSRQTHTHTHTHTHTQTHLGVETAHDAFAKEIDQRARVCARGQRECEVGMQIIVS